eukprot:NODE_2086_length_1301_cov_33.626997_g1898_i0.p1 GENE.NODE_2086_length_1301_cov_33.626997_g1898_i0~~NODE_2086_length_1301_cov_33.626997_g1898_i0.p1  ORF type:complete len:400 (-),score=54.98 NODE_2086_length_1301_cov_33.626997_g1898_i0:100-1197(-)
MTIAREENVARCSILEDLEQVSRVSLQREEIFWSSQLPAIQLQFSLVVRESFTRASIARRETQMRHHLHSAYQLASQEAFLQQEVVWRAGTSVEELCSRNSTTLNELVARETVLSFKLRNEEEMVRAGIKLLASEAVSRLVIAGNESLARSPLERMADVGRAIVRALWQRARLAANANQDDCRAAIEEEEGRAWNVIRNAQRQAHTMWRVCALERGMQGAQAGISLSALPSCTIRSCESQARREVLQLESGARESLLQMFKWTRPSRAPFPATRASGALNDALSRSRSQSQNAAKRLPFVYQDQNEVAAAARGRRSSQPSASMTLPVSSWTTRDSGLLSGQGSASQHQFPSRMAWAAPRRTSNTE